MAHRVPDQPGRFTCKSFGLLRVTAKDGDPRQPREVEANRFATLTLMPPPLVQAAMATFRNPDRQHVLTPARDFVVGKEAATRIYVQYFPKRIAIVAAGNGQVQRRFRSLAFPAAVFSVGSPIAADIARKIERGSTVECSIFPPSSITYHLMWGGKALVGQ